MKEIVVSLLEKELDGKIKKEEFEHLIEIPPSPEMGDFSFPCFFLAKTEKKSPLLIAEEFAERIRKDLTKKSEISNVDAKAGYVNFFVDKKKMAEDVLNKILKEKDKYGQGKEGKGKTIVIDLSAPNIAKPFGIGHLRSTIIGNAISNIAIKNGYRTVKINYLGDWGTQFGKLIVGYKKWGDKQKLEEEPIKHLLELYVKVNSNEELEEEARKEFKKLEDGDKNNLELWKKFKELSLKEFNKIYEILGITFDVISGESLYNTKMKSTIKELDQKGVLTKSEGALVVDLKDYNLGVCLIQKSDGATLYATRDITAAIDRYKKYKFDKMIYEVGQEQKLHFQQFFKVLELMGYDFAKNCFHVYHGLYLDQDGKKFATRKGKTVFMKEILEETIEIAKKELKKRYNLKDLELNERARKIAIAAIFYGDLKNNRINDLIFDIDKFLDFDGNTGPYLLYSYARANSIIKKVKNKSKEIKIIDLKEQEIDLIKKLNDFPEIVKKASNDLAPNLIANYIYDLAQCFNTFYHECPVLGSAEEGLRLKLVEAFKIVIKSGLNLLGIQEIQEM